MQLLEFINKYKNLIDNHKWKSVFVRLSPISNQIKLMKLLLKSNEYDYGDNTELLKVLDEFERFINAGKFIKAGKGRFFSVKELADYLDLKNLTQEKLAKFYYLFEPEIVVAYDRKIGDYLVTVGPIFKAIKNSDRDISNILPPATIMNFWMGK